MAVSLSMSIRQNSQSTSGNYSNVTVDVTASWTYGSFNATGQCYGSIEIDGEEYEFSGITFNSSQSSTGSKVVMSKTVNVYHKSDGTKTVYCSAMFYTGVSSGTIYADKSKTLTTIARKSSFTVGNGTLGKSLTISITRDSSSFTHTITYKCGSASGTIVSKTSSTSVSWTPPLSLASQNTTGKSLSVTLTMTTYSGSTNVGDSSKTITLTIPDTVKPTVSFTVSDATTNFSEFGNYVQGLSKLKIIITGTGAYGSTIKSYETETAMGTYNGQNITTGVLTTSGTVTIKVTVYDSRGNSGTLTKTVSAIAYDYPVISSLETRRVNQDGSSNPNGSYLAITFSGSVTPLSNKNTATYKLQYKKASATSYTTQTLTQYSGVYNVVSGKVIISAENNSSYDIILTITDKFKSTNKTTTGSSVRKVWSLLVKAGEIVGIAFNKIAEIEGMLDIDMVIRARKGIIVDSPWIDLEVDSAYAIYDRNTGNRPMYKVTGNVVTVKGAVSPKVAYTSSNDPVVIARGIPEEYSPPTFQQFVCQGSGMNRWNCTIKSDGTITMARYGVTEPTTVSTSAWLIFSCTYQI